MHTYAVQQSYTFEWVTASTHDDFSEAEEAALALVGAGAAIDRVRIVES